MKKRLALITWSGLPEGADSERRMLPYLAANNVEAKIVDWRTPGCDFSHFDLIVLRSCWDYHLRAAEFTDWLRRTAPATQVLNAVETVLWNHNKFYLREVAAQAIEIAPTVFVSRVEELGAAEQALIFNWGKVVVKPAVSASAHNTWLMDSTELSEENERMRKLRGQPFLVQQFIPEIQQQGEISFVYIDGRFSHAALKRPAAGDFRVQQEHGGSSELFHAGAALLRQADEIAASVERVRKSLYCRIDAVARDGKLVLMELELIEPELYLGLAEGAAERFARAIVRRIR
jgi:glutathione synthase/RimK-type ligase-like ATP-grasp enzyme